MYMDIGAQESLVGIKIRTRRDLYMCIKQIGSILEFERH